MVRENNSPRIIFWELTKQCNLKCRHCRAEASDEIHSDELNIDQIKKIISDITLSVKPLIVFTGGEPLYRKDLFEIIEYADSLGAKIALATNGILIDEHTALQIKNSAVKRVSISLDGADEKTHDAFRGVKGAFEGALRAAAILNRSKVEYQYNTTINKTNVSQLAAIIRLAEKMQAAALHLFMLVPVGCGIKLAANEEISKEQYEDLLKEVYTLSRKSKIDIKATCAPHYQRIIQEYNKDNKDNKEINDNKIYHNIRGCMAATGICFISNKGDLQACGYLPVKAGNLLNTSFKELWENSGFLNDIRDIKKIKGKCKICKYLKVCSGCRARAYAASGDYFEEEPYCLYLPTP